MQIRPGQLQSLGVAALEIALESIGQISGQIDQFTATLDGQSQCANRFHVGIEPVELVTMQTQQKLQQMCIGRIVLGSTGIEGLTETG